MEPTDWNTLKTISEVVKNWVQVAGVLGAVFLFYRWVVERKDRSTQVLFELETRFAAKEVQAGGVLVEEDAAYEGIRRALLEAALPAEEVEDRHSAPGATSPAVDEQLAPLDALLRFFVLLLGIRQAGQVPDRSLRACYRYWLAHCFSPCRRELRIYVERLFPTLHRWLTADRGWWRRWTHRSFFRPEDFGWRPESRFSREPLRRAVEGKVLVITGAGISAESGIPTYRGPEGLWRKHHPEKLATCKAFERDPRLVWEWYRERRARVRAAEPSPAHRRLVEIAERAREFLLLTQNVDDLHERAGTRPEHLVHIHGEILLNRCTSEECARVDREERADESVPLCPDCRAPLRPGVIWFDEDYEPEQLERVESFLASGPCDLVIVIGTSARFVDIVDWALRAAGGSGCLVEINPERTCLTVAADKWLRMPAGVGIERLLQTAAPAARA